MRTPKVYLDTSVISHLDQPKKPIEQEYSLRLWDAIIAGEYEVWLSEVVFEELDRCEAEKRKRLYDYLYQIKYNNVALTDEIKALADLVMERKILPKNCANDSRHIIAALTADCDFLLSWNLKHLANYRTNQQIRLIAIEEFRYDIAIVQPSYLLEGDFRYEEKPTPAPGDKR
jgi:predicted nucleic acid-binding protein